ncbi:MerR family DNA-binding transcriptional regulator [Pararhizobium arenae]|uniref:MerR family DNA-binding transcriptional regulator n=1 Tax=Pararhizobium arenae TaxID=1856850 RepID=UPI00094B2791|nr:MerR family DNA-binding transcriptional regulator [Pararhizobium arenae]
MAADKKRPLSIGEIAHELGVSTKTVRRYHAAGKLRTFEGDGKTSPIKMRAIDLTRYIKKGGG